MNHGSLSLTALETRDPERAMLFYGRIAGWTFAPGEAEGLTLCRLGETPVAAFCRVEGPEPHGYRDHWITWITVDDLDTAQGEALARGASLMRGPFAMPGAGRSAVLREPGGAVSGLVEAGPGHRPLPPSGRNPGQVWWRSLNVRDAARSRAYHEAVSGWRFRSLPMQDARYLLGYGAGEPLAGIYPMSGPLFDGLPDNWLTYLAVESCDRAADEAARGGGRIIHPPRNIRAVCRLAVVTDPGGAPVALAEPHDTLLSRWTLPFLRLIGPR
jgi:uncharacterized protein